MVLAPNLKIVGKIKGACYTTFKYTALTIWFTKKSFYHEKTFDEKSESVFLFDNLCFLSVII